MLYARYREALPSHRRHADLWAWSSRRIHSECSKGVRFDRGAAIASQVRPAWVCVLRRRLCDNDDAMCDEKRRLAFEYDAMTKSLLMLFRIYTRGWVLPRNSSMNACNVFRMTPGSSPSRLALHWRRTLPRTDAERKFHSEFVPPPARTNLWAFRFGRRGAAWGLPNRW